MKNMQIKSLSVYVYDLMCLMNRMYFNMLFILIVVSLCQVVISVSFKTKVVVLEYTSHHLVDPSNVAYRPADSLMVCVRLCQKTSDWSFNYDSNNKHCYCHDSLSASENFGGGQSILNGYPEFSQITNDSNQGSYIRSYPLYIDCLELYNQGFQKDGIYTISLETGPRLVRCDQNNGGWTVIQRREYGEESFYRSGQLYVDGFGEVYGDYWIGLENIRYLTETSSSLVIEMETFGDTSPNEAFARYSNFQLDSGSNQYRLAVSGFEGDCDDGLEYHNGAKFSTYDFDNDIASDRDCADEGQGGWWYVMCYDSNLNGPYSHSSYVNVVNDAGITWASCWGYGYSLKRVEMKVKRN